jgi:26S proteasome regulatory subunit T5
MASVPPPDDPTISNNTEKAPEQPAQGGSGAPDGTAVMDTTPDVPAEETWEDIPEEIRSLSTDEVLTRIRLIENDIKVRGVLVGIAT